MCIPKLAALGSLSILTLGLLSSTPALAAVAAVQCTVNLVNNTTTCGGVPGVSFVAPPASGQTVMNIDLSTYQSARFDVTYNAPPTNWTVDIADSSTDNGWGGDAGTQSNDAETQVLNQDMSVYGSDACHGQLLQNVPGFAQSGGTITFVVSNNRLDYLNASGSGTLTSSCLYALAGQPDTEGPVNYNIFAAFNRVVATSSRSGTGVSSVLLTLTPPAGCWALQYSTSVPFPNPADYGANVKERMNLVVLGTDGQLYPAVIRSNVYNALGQLVYTQALPANSSPSFDMVVWPVGPVASGVYNIKVRAETTICGSSGWTTYPVVIVN
jgi:hypothetical protein